MKITQRPFGKLWDREASLYTLKNNQGMTLQISNYGGIITHWYVPDRHGDARDIVLGFDTFHEYLEGHPFFGCIVGRFANRIKGGRFTLEGRKHQLAAQAEGKHLHGGLRGFDKHVWDAQCKTPKDSVGLILKLYSPDGDEAYPGSLSAEVRYTLHANNRFCIDYQAIVEERPTIINLTNHSYFNLSGNLENHGQGIVDHDIQIRAQRYVEVDAGQIPTGNLPSIAGTYLDCNNLRNMGDMFDQAPDGVVDHCYVLQESAGKFLHAATVEAPSTGIRMKLFTDNVGVQFYNSNKLGAQNKIGKNAIPYQNFAGFCLETQGFPDAPNHAQFPSCTLYPGEIYRYSAEFQFEVF